MFEGSVTPLPIKGMAAPLLRPLPAIITYATFEIKAGYGGSPAARSIFTSHLRAFRAMLIALARSAGLPDTAIRRLISRCEDLKGAGFWDLPGILAGFKADLQLLHEDHGKSLKEAAREQSGRLRDLFRVETGPCRIVTIHNDETEQLAAALCAKLVDGCWYDCETSHENEGSGRLQDADLVLLVAGESPIRPDFEAAVDQAGLPHLVLFGGGRGGDRENMAALRTEHHYRDRGYVVLRGPLAPLRLYQAIDGCRIRRLLKQETFSPEPTEIVTA
ncbi:MAG: hypothetical protein ABFS42_16755 [Candidatus Krumholzibacteriota bacterium]